MIRKIVLTGGPCAGKTSALAYLQTTLQQAGYTAIIVPEAATIAIMAGFKPGANIPGFDFQKLVAQTIIELEKSFITAAEKLSTDKVVLLCDRGMMDGQAYTGESEFQKLLKEFSATEVLWRDSPYDAVIHLRTTARGAEEFYTLANNAARSESADEAKILDEKTVCAWVGHPHLRVIDNSTRFQEKLHRVRQEVFQVLGMPVPIETERKFLIDPIEISALPVHTVTIDIEQIYLLSTDGSEVRVRKRGQNGSFAYYRTVKRTIGPGQRAETEEQIEEREFRYSLRYKIPESAVIQKKRTCFLWEEQYFELDQFSSPIGLSMLEIELTEKQTEVIWPPFLTKIEEVTDNPAYKNAALAFPNGRP